MFRAFTVDPGYNGRLIFAVYNAGPAPVHLRQGQDFFLIWYADLDPSYSEEDSERKPGYQSLEPEILMPGQISSLDTLNERLRSVEDQQKYYQAVAAILISVALLMLGVIFKIPQAVFSNNSTVHSQAITPTNVMSPGSKAAP